MTRVTVEFEWQPVGEIRLEGTRPVFPLLPAVPGLYRFSFDPASGQRRVYIGETDNLRRRTQHYRTPGATEPTNLRMNRELVDAISVGTRISYSTITTATISIDDRAPRALGLARKTSRLIVENAAMAAAIAARAAGPTAPVLVNRPGVGEDDWA